ncbi:MAG: hypothetical protein GY808_07025, partial [Gammaproteobacteria bacterium]|nr:hypothetical protein [Gammaproteobacteria bacterium]
WVNGDAEEGNVDNSAQDDMKYDQLAKGGYEIFTEPQDVRQLAASGPYINMEPGETVEVTIAVVAGGSLDGLRKNAEKAYERYDLAYIGPAPPPSPKLTLQPGNNRVIVGWDNFPEDKADPFSKKLDFEGYRIYRSDDNGLSWGDEATDLERYPNGFTPIAEFDIAGNESGRFVSTSYFSGTSKAQIKFEDFTTNVDDYYNESEYSLEFQQGKNLVVYNLTQLISYSYNRTALADGEGFSIIDRETNVAMSSPEYVSNALITFDGIYISIKNDTSIVDGVQQISAPSVGDVFKIQTFESQQIGEQAGIDYVFIDENLINGVDYSYAVTSFDAGDLTIGLPSLESSFFSNKKNVIPRAVSVDRTIETIGSIEKVIGEGNGVVSIQKHHPLEMVTANFNVEFFNDETIASAATHMRILNNTADTTVVDSILLQNGGATYSFYGIDLTAAAPVSASIDVLTFDWKSGSSSSNFFNIVADKIGPYDYEIEFVNSLSDEIYIGDTLIVPPNGSAFGPWTIRNLTLNSNPKSYSIPLIIGANKFKHGSNLRVMKEDYANANDFTFGVILDAQDSTDNIEAGDIWVVNSIKPFLNGEVYSFST